MVIRDVGDPALRYDVYDLFYAGCGDTVPAEQLRRGADDVEVALWSISSRMTGDLRYREVTATEIAAGKLAGPDVLLVPDCHRVQRSPGRVAFVIANPGEGVADEHPYGRRLGAALQLAHVPVVLYSAP